MAAVTPPIAHCPSCNKPFVNDRSRSRHVRYCGTRIRTRPRSCRECSAAKTKCSFGQPCSRCLRKGNTCIYDGSAWTPSTPQLDIGSPSLFTTSLDPWSWVEHGTAMENGDRLRHILLAESPSTSTNAASHSSNESSAGSTDATYSFSDQSSGYELLYPPSFESALAQTLAPPCQRAISSKPSWCTWPSNFTNLSLMIQSTASVPSFDAPLARYGLVPHHYADLIVQSMRAIPTMMLRRKTFPWFVHSYVQPLELGETDSLAGQPLVNCMSVAQLFVSRTAETRPIMYSTMTKELRRLLDHKLSMPVKELLAAVQACMVYSTMCIIDNSQPSKDVNLELLQTLNELYFHFKKTTANSVILDASSTPSTAWSDWVFAESQKRLAYLWFLIGCVICVKSGIDCDPTRSCRSLPLPAPKTLWEASTETAWEAEREAVAVLQSSSLTNLGDLMDAHRASHTAVNAQKLDRWNAGIDTLGSLLNLVGPMLG